MADSGDTITIYNGTYSEQVIIKDGVNMFCLPLVTITSDNVNGTIIDNGIEARIILEGNPTILNTGGGEPFNLTNENSNIDESNEFPDLIVSGNLNVIGNSLVTGSFNVSGSLIVTGSTNIAGNLYLSGSEISISSSAFSLRDMISTRVFYGNQGLGSDIPSQCIYIGVNSEPYIYSTISPVGIIIGSPDGGNVPFITSQVTNVSVGISKDGQHLLVKGGDARQVGVNTDVGGGDLYLRGGIAGGGNQPGGAVYIVGGTGAGIIPAPPQIEYPYVSLAYDYDTSLAYGKVVIGTDSHIGNEILYVSGTMDVVGDITASNLTINGNLGVHGIYNAIKDFKNYYITSSNFTQSNQVISLTDNYIYNYKINVAVSALQHSGSAGFDIDGVFYKTGSYSYMAGNPTIASVGATYDFTGSVSASVSSSGDLLLTVQGNDNTTMRWGIFVESNGVQML